MNIWRRIALFAFSLAFTGVALAAQEYPPATTLQVTAEPVAPVTVAAGKPARVQMKFRVSPGFHINSNQPGSELLIPTVLHLGPPTDIGVGKITYPAGQPLMLAIAPGERLSVYSGEFAIAANVSATRTATPGKYVVHGFLKYQACNDRACFPPRQAPLEVPVTVTKSQIRSHSTAHNPPQSPHIHQ
jgi:DsbC/DsbD-like thiol-disulfide interchange protein